MKLTRTCLFLASMTTLVIGAGASTFAAEDHNIDVSATITKKCVITTDAVSFGTYDFTLATDNDVGVGAVNFTCTKNTATTIQLSIGTGGSEPQRRMTSGSNKLDYALFTDALRKTPWTTTDLIDGKDVGPVYVYGRIPAGQNKPAGSYTDTVVATITF